MSQRDKAENLEKLSVLVSLDRIPDLLPKEEVGISNHPELVFCFSSQKTFQGQTVIEIDLLGRIRSIHSEPEDQRDLKVRNTMV